MNELLSEPGFWAIALVLLFTGIQALGAWLGREPFQRLASLALAMDSDGELSAEEKRFAADMMGMATAWYTTPVLMACTPFISIYVCARAIYLTASGKGLSEAKLLGKFPKNGPFTKPINHAVWASRPIVVVWGVIWMIPVLITLALTLGSTKVVPALVSRASMAIFARAAHR